MTAQPEFSRVYRLDQLEADTIEVDLAANADERAALARRFDLLALDGLTAHVRLRRLDKGRAAEAKGRLSADVVQACVVTLEPLPAHVEADFRIRFLPPELLAAADGEADITLDYEEEDVEPLDHGALDLGEAVAQHLALALDPWPRKPGAEWDGPPPEPEPEVKRPSPFTVLKHKG